MLTNWFETYSFIVPDDCFLQNLKCVVVSCFWMMLPLALLYLFFVCQYCSSVVGPYYDKKVPGFRRVIDWFIQCFCVSRRNNRSSTGRFVWNSHNFFCISQHQTIIWYACFLLIGIQETWYNILCATRYSTNLMWKYNILSTQGKPNNVQQNYR